MLKLALAAGMLSFSLGATLPAHAQGPGHDGALHHRADGDVVDVLIQRDLAREALSNKLAPVGSRDGLAAFMRVAGPGHPLNRLSSGAKERFLESLTFNDNGLTGYRYDDLLAELTASEIYQVLGLLGAQDSAPFMGSARVVDELDRVTVQSFGFGGTMCDQQGSLGGATCSGDIENAKCVSPGTCQLHHVGYVCKSTC